MPQASSAHVTGRYEGFFGVAPHPNNNSRYKNGWHGQITTKACNGAAPYSLAGPCQRRRRRGRSIDADTGAASPPASGPPPSLPAADHDPGERYCDLSRSLAPYLWTVGWAASRPATPREVHRRAPAVPAARPLTVSCHEKRLGCSGVPGVRPRLRRPEPGPPPSPCPNRSRLRLCLRLSVRASVSVCARAFVRAFCEPPGPAGALCCACARARAPLAAGQWACGRRSCGRGNPIGGGGGAGAGPGRAGARAGTGRGVSWVAIVPCPPPPPHRHTLQYIPLSLHAIYCHDV